MGQVRKRIKADFPELQTSLQFVIQTKTNHHKVSIKKKPLKERLFYSIKVGGDLLSHVLRQYHQRGWS